jgi:hypothetical protein
MNSPESNEAPSNTEMGKLVHRFNDLLEGASPPVSTTLNHLLFLKRHITKRIVTQRVDDQKYLTGPGRTPDWGQLTVERITSDVIRNLITKKVLSSRSEYFAIRFDDHTTFNDGRELTDKFIDYEFTPRNDDDLIVIIEPEKRIFHPNDSFYPRFLISLEMAEELLSH